MKRTIVVTIILAVLAGFCCNLGTAYASMDDMYNDIYYAMQSNEVPRLKESLKKNAKAINHKSGDILQGACGMVMDPQIIKLLLDAGADPNLPQVNSGKNALHLILEETTPENSTKVLSIVRMLVAKGCSVNHKRAHDGWTPLHVAARKNHTTKEIFSALVNAPNADVNLTCNRVNEYVDGAFPPLFFVIDRGMEDTTDTTLVMAKLLLNKGANLGFTTMQDDTAEKRKWNALHYVCGARADRSDIVQLFLDAGMELETPVLGSKMTPLHIALMANNPNICQLLLEKGASINTANSDGVTVVRHAEGVKDRIRQASKVILDWAASNK